MVIRDGKIANYHPYPPTPWNANPRDSYGTPGPYEDAVQGQPIFEENDREHFKGIDIMRTVRSFDPCLPCGVHMYLGDGKKLELLHSPDPVRQRRVDAEPATMADRRTPADADLGRPASGSRRCSTASAAGGVVARERAEELVRLVADLYGAGLERLLDIVHEPAGSTTSCSPRSPPTTWSPACCWCTACTPTTSSTRVEQALESVRPYLGSHGGDVELLEVTEDGAVRLRLLGSCDGCPSSSVTLKLAVEGAIEAAAPEVTAIEVEEAPGARRAGTVSSRCRRCAHGSTHGRRRRVRPGVAGSRCRSSPTWRRARSTTVEVADTAVAGRAGSARTCSPTGDRCARCEAASMRGAALARRLGGGRG